MSSEQIDRVELYRRALLLAAERVDELVGLVEEGMMYFDGSEITVCPPGLDCPESGLDCDECWSLWFLDEAERLEEGGLNAASR